MIKPKMSTKESDDARWPTVRAQLAAAVRYGSAEEVDSLREELKMIGLRRRGREIAAALPPPTEDQIRFIADVFGMVAVPEGSAAE